MKAVVVGYAGGTTKNPNYENHDGFLESIRVTYDPAVISYPKLVDAFFRHIDPTDPGGQICDRGPSYRAPPSSPTTPPKRPPPSRVKAQVNWR